MYYHAHGFTPAHPNLCHSCRRKTGAVCWRCTAPRGPRSLPPPPFSGRGAFGDRYGWRPSPSSNLPIRGFRAQISQLELFELIILLLKLDKRLPVEQFEATVAQSTVPSSPLIPGLPPAAPSCPARPLLSHHSVTFHTLSYYSLTFHTLSYYSLTFHALFDYIQQPPSSRLRVCRRGLVQI